MGQASRKTTENQKAKEIFKQTYSKEEKGWEETVRGIYKNPRYGVGF